MKDETDSAIQPQIYTRYSLLPLRDVVVFPYMVLPLFVGRAMSIKALEAALAGDRMVFFSTQKSHETETPSPDDIFSIGTVGMIIFYSRECDTDEGFLAVTVVTTRLSSRGKGSCSRPALNRSIEDPVVP